MAYRCFKPFNNVHNNTPFMIITQFNKAEINLTLNVHS